MTSMLSRIQTHLDSDGAVQVTTYLRSTIYHRKHRDWFSVDGTGHLMVRSGRKTVSLGPDKAPWVRVGFSVEEAS